MASGEYSFAINENCNANGDNSFAGGKDSTATNDQSFAFGNLADATGAHSFALGNQANSSGVASIAIGTSTKALGINSLAIGSSASSTANYATAIGRQTSADAIYSTAVGYQSTASGISSTALGVYATSSGYSAVAIGGYCVASSLRSFAIGTNVASSGEDAIGIGNNVQPSGEKLVLIGLGFGSAVGNVVMLGNEKEAIRINTKSVIFNELSNDIDFRFEGDTEPNLFFLDAGNDRIGIGTATPTHTLNVVGDVNVTGNLYSNYSYSKNQVSQFHRVATATAASADTWYNITFDLEIDDETISDWYNLTDSNSSITINGFEGIIRVQGCIHPYNDDVGNQEASFYARVLVNGIEARCLQRADSKSFKSDGIDTLDIVGTVVVEDGDVITYQWRTSNTNIQLEGDTVFDNPVSASLNFERISELD